MRVVLKRLPALGGQAPLAVRVGELFPAEPLKPSVEAALSAADGVGPLLLRCVRVVAHLLQEGEVDLALGSRAVFGALFITRAQRRQLDLPALGVENVPATRQLDAEGYGLEFEAAQLALPVEQDKTRFRLFPEREVAVHFVEDGARAVGDQRVFGCVLHRMR